MKKVITLTAAAILVIFVFSCSKGPAGEQGPAGADAGSGDFVMKFKNYVYPTQTYQGIVDARLWSNSPDTNYGSSGANEIGSHSDTSIKRLVIQFNVGYLPDNAAVKEAYITMYMTGILLGAPEFAFYSLTEGFNESYVTWNNRNNVTLWTDAGGTHDSTKASNTVTVASEDEFYTWSLDASVVQGWVDNPGNNYGLLLKAQETGENQVEMALTEYGTSRMGPELMVVYTLD